MRQNEEVGVDTLAKSVVDRSEFTAAKMDVIRAELNLVVLVKERTMAALDGNEKLATELRQQVRDKVGVTSHFDLDS